MHCVKQVDQDLYWVGGNDRRLTLFENIHPIPKGISYNSFLLMDEKTVLLDTVDRAITDLFMENVLHVLDQRPLDYIVMNHMEPDHCGTLIDLLRLYPKAIVVGNPKTFQIIRQLYNLTLEDRSLVVGNGDTLVTGKHTLRFITMPMVHWPEVMATFDETNGTLFSADAFGTFGALSGHLFADELEFEKDWLDETRRYYSNIVGKYGSQVQDAFKKLLPLNPRMICPLHGPVWRKNLDYILEKYQKWSLYQPEEPGVVIACGSIYGNTENAANILACRLADLGVRRVVLYDVSATDPSYILSDVFRFSHLVIASSTYNNGIFTRMENLLEDLAAHRVQNRRVAIIENGSWHPNSGKLISTTLSGMKDIHILNDPLTIRSALAPGQDKHLEDLARLIAQDLLDTGSAMSEA